MDIQAEKLQLIEQLTKLQDVNVITRIKELLQGTLEKDELLENSIDRGVKQSKSGKVQAHHEVMSAIRTKYGA